MNNPYATPDQIERVKNIEKYMHENPAGFGSKDHAMWVFGENTVKNLINSFRGNRANNPIGSKKHNDHVFSLVIKTFEKWEGMR